MKTNSDIRVQVALAFDLKHFASFREAVLYAIKSSGKSKKEIASALGISESRLTMMLSEYDKRHFPLALLPSLLAVLGDPGKVIIHWLVNEFLLSPEEAKRQAENTLARYRDILPIIADALQVIASAEEGEKR